jgi:hypothetical protein
MKRSPLSTLRWRGRLAKKLPHRFPFDFNLLVTFLSLAGFLPMPFLSGNVACLSLPRLLPIPFLSGNVAFLSLPRLLPMPFLSLADEEVEVVYVLLAPLLSQAVPVLGFPQFRHERCHRSLQVPITCNDRTGPGSDSCEQGV